ncbi:NAD(P)H:quinone oxidoreductase [Paenibacillus sp. KN14-4R]|uniref:NAD(P)H:quinone oxidoreductase n=1 Tax=Paenibacillus sp. KN14-4R TaxID=3445773 RepID=UPI003F9FAA5A
MTNILIPYYSAYGHIYSMAKAVAEGASQLEGVNVRMVRIPEFDFLKEKMQSQPFYVQAQEVQKDIPEATHADLSWADGIVWGIPSRYGSMPAQVKQFLDSASWLWMKGELEGKATAVFTSSGSIHGGQEATILTSLVPLLHFGLVFVGLPYAENPEQLTADGIGGSPYGASTVAGPDGTKTPDPRELVMAARLGARVAKVSKALQTLK